MLSCDVQSVAPCILSPARSNQLRYMLIGKAIYNPPPHTAMRRDVIQDKHRAHEDQTVHEPYLSDTSGDQYERGCQAGCKHVNRSYSQIRSAAATRQTRSGQLSSTKRQQLDRVVFTMNQHFASMKERLLRASNSPFIDPAFLKKLATELYDLDRYAVYIKKYKEKNEENGTALLKIRAMANVEAARNWFTYLDKIMGMEPYVRKPMNAQQSVEA